MPSILKIGVAGVGTVGAALIAQIADQRDALEARCGRRIEVVAVCARNKKKTRCVDLRKI
jgi:homoserine dehydrogenase